VLDTFAAAHAGLAPVVVTDRLGATFANLLCGDLPLGDTVPYLSVDGPAWIRAHLQVDPTPQDWAVGGLSSGHLLPAVGGQRTPGVPDVFGLRRTRRTHPRRSGSTVNATFGGSATVSAQVNPLDVLKGQRLPAAACVISAGRDDAEYGPLARRVVAACTAVGMNIHQLPGGHTWAVWAAALTRSVPFFRPAGAV